MKLLGRHPFGVRAYFDTSLVLGFAAPIENLAPLLPTTLELDTFANRFGFLAVAAVRTRQLRPEPFPAAMGSRFLLIGYRLFVRYRTSEGRKLRGLYILRSETDSLRMKLLGSVFTSYCYHRLPIDWQENEERIEVSSAAGLAMQIRKGAEDTKLPATSPFADWREARRFAGPMPFTFSVDEMEDEVLIVEGVRDSWKPKPVSVESASIPFLDSLGIDGLHLANAFVVNQVPYRWKRGIIDRPS